MAFAILGLKNIGDVSIIANKSAVKVVLFIFNLLGFDNNTSYL
jgi:hypothetical protein